MMIDVNTILNSLIVALIAAIMFILRDIKAQLRYHEEKLDDKVSREECRDYREQICSKIDLIR